jgi:streptogramin lyase
VRGRGLAAVAGVVVIAAAIALAAVALSGDEEANEPVAIVSNSLVLIDPEENRVVDAVPLGGRPTRLAYGEGAFWVVAPEVRQVVRVDEEGGTSRFDVGAEPYDVAVGAGGVWVPDHDLRRLLRVDAETGEVRQTVDLGGPAVAAGYGFGAAWVVVAPGSLVRVDPDTLRVTTTTLGVSETAEFAEPKLAFGADALWISSPANGVLTRVDAEARTKATRVASGITSVATRRDAVWTTLEDGYLTQVGGGDRARLRVGQIPIDVAVARDAVWVADYEGNAVNRIEWETRRVVATIRLGLNPVAVAVGESLVAVAVEESPF